MKTIKNILFGAMTLASLASVAQTNIQYGTSNYNPDKVHLDSISDTYRDAVLKVYLPNETNYSEVDVVKNISYDTIYSYDIDSKKMNPSMISEVQYNSNHKIATAITKYWDSESLQWFVYSIYTYDYDTLGNITYCENSLRESTDLALTPQYKIEESYDKYSRKTQVFNYKWQDNQWVINTGEKYSYETDAHNNNITKCSTFLFLMESGLKWVRLRYHILIIKMDIF
ncbi:MAG: hypothetical protein IPO21_06445 [Bacteroidales bacterium]|nr:hypothetical protein [Bacteroidales bacterium]